jgi:hypothetical protein
MARRAFFSFKYADVSRAMVVRNSWVLQGREAAGFIDAASFEELKTRGDTAIRRWIDAQIKRTTVTVVLVGSGTCRSRWVKYEIAESQRLGHGLLGVDISKIKDFRGRTATRCGQIPRGYPFYQWPRDEGHRNLGLWIDKAARSLGK